MENPRFPVSLFTASVLCLLAVLVLTLASAPCAKGSDIDIFELKARAMQGDADAQFNLGHMYAKGEGVSKDATEAVKWWRMAAEQGFAIAQNSLGLMYDRGIGVPKDATEAVKWFRKAAEQGDADAQFNLGLMYYKGEGVPKNAAEAVKWWRKAVEQGNAIAQCNLGAMYHRGEGVPKNNVQAYKWWNLAAAGGDELAAENRRLLEREMTPAQIAEAQRLSDQFVPRKAGAETTPETSPSP